MNICGKFRLNRKSKTYFEFAHIRKSPTLTHSDPTVEKSFSVKSEKTQSKHTVKTFIRFQSITRVSSESNKSFRDNKTPQVKNFKFHSF